MPWPPRSSDLTTCDCFLWGYIKSKVYAERCAILDDLREKIKTAFEGISKETRPHVIEGYRRRLERCLKNDGDYVVGGM